MGDSRLTKYKSSREFKYTHFLPKKFKIDKIEIYYKKKYSEMPSLDYLFEPESSDNSFGWESSDNSFDWESKYLRDEKLYKDLLRRAVDMSKEEQERIFKKNAKKRIKEERVTPTDLKEEISKLQY